MSKHTVTKSSYKNESFSFRHKKRTLSFYENILNWIQYDASIDATTRIEGSCAHLTSLPGLLASASEERKWRGRRKFQPCLNFGNMPLNTINIKPMCWLHSVRLDSSRTWVPLSSLLILTPLLLCFSPLHHRESTQKREKKKKSSCWINDLVIKNTPTSSSCCWWSWWWW